jgi:hypothetical protein
MVDPIANGTDIDIPVLNRGCRPAGRTSALALTRDGVPCLNIAEHHSTAHTPRAHIVNQRAVGIFRALGISKAFHEVATPQSMMSNNSWVTILADPEVARSQAWASRQIDSPITSWAALNLWPTAHRRGACSFGPSAMSYGAASLPARLGRSNYPTPSIVYRVPSHRRTRRKHLAHQRYPCPMHGSGRRSLRRSFRSSSSPMPSTEPSPTTSQRLASTSNQSVWLCSVLAAPTSPWAAMSVHSPPPTSPRLSSRVSPRACSVPLARSPSLPRWLSPPYGDRPQVQE